LRGRTEEDNGVPLTIAAVPAKYEHGTYQIQSDVQENAVNLESSATSLGRCGI
jgi:hypothetical protein